MKNTVILLSAFFISAPFCAAFDFAPDDFAGAMVYSGREGSLLTLEIPVEAYAGIRRPDRGDIRIFDASGQAVPFAVREKPKETYTPEPRTVPFFPWNGGKENNLPAGTDIEINTQGGVVKIKNQNPAPESSRTFLADLSSLEYLPGALRIKTENKGGNFNAPLTIHYSGDLSAWSVFTKKQTIANFSSPDTGTSSVTVLDTVELPKVPGIKDMRYLLVTFENGAPLPLEISALFTSREKPAEYHEIVINGLKSPDGKRVSYNTKAYYPAESVDFVLTGADSIEVIVKNRMDEKEEWNIAARETIFRYNAPGGITKNLPFKIETAAPYWELEAAGGFLFGSVPGLVIRVSKKELVFPGRGKGPWTLAYGNAEAGPLEANLRIPPPDEGEFEKALFTGEGRYDETAGLASPNKNRRREITLWVFLGAAALVLSLLAVYIARSMRT